MKKLIQRLFIGFLLSGVCCHLSAQNVTITPNGITPALSATYPRLAYDAILALGSPQKGDIAYDLTFACLRVYTGTKWICSNETPGNRAPNISPIITAGSTEFDNGESIKTDASGNIYVAGTFTGTVNFGGISKSSAGQKDIFLAKYTKAGTLVWIQTAGGAEDDIATGLDIDADGNIYVTGSFSATASFDNNSLISAGEGDMYVAKYNNSGTLQWIRAGGGIKYDGGYDVAVDNQGNVYVTGVFTGNSYFSGIPQSGIGVIDAFICKYDSTGALLWIQTAGGTNTDVFPNGVDTDANGNVFIAGNLLGTASFSGISLSTAGSYDIFIAKYNSSGTIQWAINDGGTKTDMAYDIAVDSDGNVYVTGRFANTATFGNVTRQAATSINFYLLKYYNNGNFSWVKTSATEGSDAGQDLTVDANNNIYVAGYFNSVINLSGLAKPSVGNEDIFVARFNSEGGIQWIQSIGGIDTDRPAGIAPGTNGNMYITGYFKQTATFGNVDKTSAGKEDFFILRLQE